jgi:site-specific recombinase XerD
MRHTFAHAVLRASGNDLAVTQQLLGHASIATTGIYIKADVSQRHRAVMAMTPLFDSGGLSTL